jgi:RNA polymerase sigma-70 factor (ECF subfamily)
MPSENVREKKQNLRGMKSGGARAAQPALIDGAVGLIIAPRGRLFRALRFTLAHGKIAQVEVIGNLERLRTLDLAVLAP